jgi:hypothetical protein
MLIKICFLHTNRKNQIKKKKIPGKQIMAHLSELNTTKNRKVDNITLVTSYSRECVLTTIEMAFDSLC